MSNSVAPLSRTALGTSVGWTRYPAQFKHLNCFINPHKQRDFLLQLAGTKDLHIPDLPNEFPHSIRVILEELRAVSRVLNSSELKAIREDHSQHCPF